MKWAELTAGLLVLMALLHEPKTDNIKKRHQVLKFGHVHPAEDEDEKKMYEFLHQRYDLKKTSGAIPVGFLSQLPCEGHNLYLDIRAGYDEGIPMGPQFRVRWKSTLDPLPGPGDGWMNNLDDLWVSVLSHLERKNVLSPNTLDDLDADPFVLFGIDDPVTQQALQKLQTFPALMCENAIPVFEEWAAYLRIAEPEEIKALGWLIKAFMETELPKPWTCYKGVGSIVCFIRADSGQVKWRHPFYDYFAQLRDFCREAIKNGSEETIMQVRANRLLWSYEASRVESEHDQDPLICPDYIERMADIFNYDIRITGCIVRNLKAQLRLFARKYNSRGDIPLEMIATCKEILDSDVKKYQEMCQQWGGQLDGNDEEESFQLAKLADGEIKCVNGVNCNDSIALCYCLECKDYMCLKCFDSLHMKGARAEHNPFRLVPCSLCVQQPAKLHCTFTDKSLCHPCYAMVHIKMLPADGKENFPRRIDYVAQYKRFERMATERLELMMVERPTSDGPPESSDAVLSNYWHPFYDIRGVKYYHNFATGERMRQSPRRLPNTEDPGVPPGSVLDKVRTTEQLKTTFDGKTLKPMTRLEVEDAVTNQLTGFDSLTSFPKAQESANPDLRALRAPFRKER